MRSLYTVDSPPPAEPPAGVAEVTAWAIAVRMWCDHQPDSLMGTTCVGCRAPWPCPSWEVADGIIADVCVSRSLSVTEPAAEPADLPDLAALPVPALPAEEEPLPLVTARTVVSGGGRHAAHRDDTPAAGSPVVAVAQHAAAEPALVEPALVEPAMIEPAMAEVAEGRAAAVGRVGVVGRSARVPLPAEPVAGSARPAGTGPLPAGPGSVRPGREPRRAAAAAAADATSTEFLPRVEAGPADGFGPRFGEPILPQRYAAP